MRPSQWLRPLAASSTSPNDHRRGSRPAATTAGVSTSPLRDPVRIVLGMVGWSVSRSKVGACRDGRPSLIGERLVRLRMRTWITSNVPRHQSTTCINEPTPASWRATATLAFDVHSLRALTVISRGCAPCGAVRTPQSPGNEVLNQSGEHLPLLASARSTPSPLTQALHRPSRKVHGCPLAETTSCTTPVHALGYRPSLCWKPLRD